jgi:hypothetical protein
MQNQFFELTDVNGNIHLINLSSIASISPDENGRTKIITTAGSTHTFSLSFENAKTALQNHIVYYKEHVPRIGF